ncbi:MAG: oligosaccharide flippase family protein, partial [Actinobacteria bacterium]|nr:oligosaccharide flippase family protein [Actinomycetota bacterium]
EQRAVVGAAFVAFLAVGLAFMVTVLGASFVVDGAFRVKAGGELRAVVPVAMAYPFSLIAVQLAQGVDRLHIYSVTNVLGQGLFVGALLLCIAVRAGLTGTLALVVRSAALCVASLVLVVWLRPIFAGARRHVAALVRQARDYGLNLFVGRLLSIGTYNMDVLMLGALADARAVGLYTLAGAVAGAVGIPIQGLAAALFPRMTARRGLDRSWLAVSWLVGLSGVVVAGVLATTFLHAAFPRNYEAAAAYVVPLTLAQAIRGVTGIYNSYLAAHALGRELRNAGFILTASNLVLNIALIPPFGAAGAAWASVLALAANYAAHVLAYRRSMRFGGPSGDAAGGAAPRLSA